MKILDITHQIFSQEEARKVAAHLSRGEEDGWTYVVEDNPNPDGLKTAIIKIYDEDDKFVTLWTAP